MKKIAVLLVLSSLFIGFVMFRIMAQGVRLHERRMVKWSSVDSAEKAGQVVALHTYPLLKEQRSFVFLGESPFALDFISSFKKMARSKGVKTEFLMAHQQSRDSMVLEILPLDKEPALEECGTENSLACLKRRAFYRFNKKERDPNQLWIQMWRVSKNKMLLFFKQK